MIRKLAAFTIAAQFIGGVAIAHADTVFAGPYAGVSATYIKADIDWETTDTYAPNGTPIPASSDPKEGLSDSSFALGVFGGFNHQLNNEWLVGVELAYRMVDLSDDISDRIPGLGEANDPNSFSEVEAEKELGLGVRAGYLLQEDMVVYGSLNIIQLDAEASVTCPADTTVCNPADGTQTFKNDDTLRGWGLGLGVEKVLAEKFVIRGEYRYADYGDFDFTAFPADPTSRFGAESQVDVESHSLEIGGAYLF